MSVYKDITDIQTVDEGLQVTFDFRREDGGHQELDEEGMVVIMPSEVVTETINFLFPTEQVESLRFAEDETERTDEEIVDLLVDRCLENLNAV